MSDERLKKTMKAIKESAGGNVIDLKRISITKSEITDVIGGKIVDIQIEPPHLMNDLEVTIRNPRTVPGKSSSREIDFIARTYKELLIGYIDTTERILYIYKGGIEHLNRDTLRDAWQDTVNWEIP